jgi:hypothetical protein
MITVFMIILIALAVIALVALLILGIVDYFENYKDFIDTFGPKIKFSLFISAYKANPERWDIHDDDCVICSISDYSHEEFHFSYIDTWRYRWWKCQLENKKTANKDSELIAELLEVVKQDIESTKGGSK